MVISFQSNFGKSQCKRQHHNLEPWSFTIITFGIPYPTYENKLLSNLQAFLNKFIKDCHFKKLAKNQINAKQHPDTELLLFENYSYTLYTLSRKFYIRRSNDKVDSLKTGSIVVADLLPWSDLERYIHIIIWGYKSIIYKCSFTCLLFWTTCNLTNKAFRF